MDSTGCLSTGSPDSDSCKQSLDLESTTLNADSPDSGCCEQPLDMDSNSWNVDISRFVETDAARLVVEKKCSSTFMKMLEEGLHTDITITARGGSVNAHRCVLASTSPVFNAMFKHEMKEQLTSSVELLEMTIEGLQFFLVLLYIIPDNTAAMQEFDNAVDKHFDELIEACCKYQVTRLERTLRDALPRNLTPDNCWDYFGKCQVIQKYCLSDIPDYVITWDTPRWICYEYILDNFDKVIKSDGVKVAMRSNPEAVLRFMGVITRVVTSDLPKNQSLSHKARPFLKPL
ncbi:hypothetical protein M758_3G011700 [Ceratodon purpureus]|uniref:BTB domain-containing protein n=1 Tax=Ceratodon purpureus TaxID=3225 RepID=A0A8T0IFZ3_CERPU|nr:hypothetical protein KC19_3G011600 [Ceratodon purpureus]KAG0621333.1 hypothetical protein M758_3G011700 [Ceratodon purpureus]